MAPVNLSARGVRVNSFQGLQNLPIVTARRIGAFERAGVEVALSFTNSSAQQLPALAAGEYDLIHTAPDNVVNFDTNPAAFGLAQVTQAAQVVMLMGGSNGPLSVYIRPGAAGVDDLRGQPVGVDNPGSGFALVLRDLLARAGLERDRDYHFVTAGGTGKRAEGLAAGAFAATILYPPFDAQAARAGCQMVATSLGTYPAYASQTLAATRAWAEAHGDLARRYIGALLHALRVLYDPGQRAQVETILREEAGLGLDGLPVAEAYDSFTDAGRGYGREAALDPVGLAQVIALRARWGVEGVRLQPVETYCDLRAYAAARAEG